MTKDHHQRRRRLRAKRTRRWAFKLIVWLGQLAIPIVRFLLMDRE